MEHEQFLGRKWEHGTADCYALIRDFYNHNWNLGMADYARPKFWWHRNPELDLIRNNFATEGFVPVDHNPRTMRAGDVVLMSVGSTIVNHCGVYLGRGWLLHHPFRDLSKVTLYAGILLNQTMIVARHPGVIVPDDRPTVDLMDLLPPLKREKYLAARSSE